MRKITLFLIFLFFPIKEGFTQDFCSDFFNPSIDAVQETEESKIVLKIENRKDLADFIFGPYLNLSLLNQSHIEEAFKLGLRLYFADHSWGFFDSVYSRFLISSYKVGEWSQDIRLIKRVLEDHPHLKKEPFPDIEVRREVVRDEGINTLIEELQILSRLQVKAGHEVIHRLFQIEKSWNYWREKIFQKSKHEWTDEDSKEINHLVAVLKKTSKPKEKAKAVFNFLNQKREKLLLEGQSIRPISQAIVDLIHTISFHDFRVLRDLKSMSFFRRVQVLDRIMRERETFVGELSLEFKLEMQSFDQVLRKYGRLPSGYTRPNSIEEAYEKLKSVDFSLREEEFSDFFRIRHLSFLTAPFRGCLGVTCASRTPSLFLQAFDPSYHYFTLSNKEGYSKGYISVVLGEAHLKSTKELLKVALIDKIQNIELDLLPIVIESIRRILITRGYELAGPYRMDKISDEIRAKFSHNPSLIEVYEEEIPMAESFLENFHPYKYDFNLYKYLKMINMEPVLQSSGFLEHDFLLRGSIPLKKIESMDGNSKKGDGLIQTVSRPRGSSFLLSMNLIDPPFFDRPVEVQLDLEALVHQISLDLLNQAKVGNEVDQLRYVSFKSVLKIFEILGDLSIEQTLKNDLQSERIPFEFKFAIFLNKINENQFQSVHLRSVFSEEEVGILLNENKWLLYVERYFIEGRRVAVSILFDAWIAGFIDFPHLVQLIEDKGLLEIIRENFSSIDFVHFHILRKEVGGEDEEEVKERFLRFFED